MYNWAYGRAARGELEPDDFEMLKGGLSASDYKSMLKKNADAVLSDEEGEENVQLQEFDRKFATARKNAQNQVDRTNELLSILDTKGVERREYVDRKMEEWREEMREQHKKGAKLPTASEIYDKAKEFQEQAWEEIGGAGMIDLGGIPNNSGDYLPPKQARERKKELNSMFDSLIEKEEKEEPEPEPEEIPVIGQ
jgi:hypothetical protein